MTDFATLHVPFFGSEDDVTALRTAFTLGRDFASHIRCLHISFALDDVGVGLTYAMSPGLYQDVLHTIEQGQAEAGKAAQEAFYTIAAAENVPIADRGTAKGFSASWHRHRGNPWEVIAAEGRLSDLIVLSQAISGDRRGYEEAIGAALFESGQPVLIVPPATDASRHFKSIAIAWDGGSRAIRSVARAMPLLRRAGNVTIITCRDHMLQGPDAEALALYLASHGVSSAEPVTLEPQGGVTGNTLLASVEERGIDMLVMGAYQHSRMRELIMGGMTRHMLNHSSLPLFMVH